MSKENSFYPHKLDKQFTYLVNLFENMPLAEKDKRKWVEQRKTEKIFALVALYNPGLRENLPKNGKDITLPVSRESQSFETLLENLETFIKQNKNPSFSDFITLGKKSSESATLDLFSMTKDKSPETALAAEDLVSIRKIEKSTKFKQGVAERLWASFCVFQHLFQNKNGIKKHGGLFADFILEDKEKKLFNFPLLVLEAFNKTKAAKEKTFVGRRSPQATFEDISQEVFYETALSITEKNIRGLICFYRTVIGYEKMDTEQKIRINYLAEHSFSFPDILYEKGFSKSNESVKALCTQGRLRAEDMKKEGALLLTELLEAENIVEKLPESDMEWAINVSRNTAQSKWRKYNNMDSLLRKNTVAERKSEEEVRKIFEIQGVTEKATR